MQIETQKTKKIEKFNIGEEKSFGITNIGFIFEILRNKLYSNKIESICREVSSNARDAHREKGIPERPIEIIFPDFVENHNFIIKDFGIGISPNRIENVFIQYAESTKRNSNLETGGFGLGAKSPFAYTDAFSIKTIVDNVERLYSCFIDETQIGKISLIKETKTEKETGTEIIIPIKKQDLPSFKDGILKATKYWNPRPSFNIKLIYDEDTVLYKGKNWQINQGPSLFYKPLYAIIDGIQYKVEVNQLNLNSQTQYKNLICGFLCLYFDTGEIDLSASRENIDFTERTKEVFDDAIIDVNCEFKKFIDNKIENCKNFNDALMAYNEFCNLWRTIPKSWNGKPLWNLLKGGPSCTFFKKVEENLVKKRKFLKTDLNNSLFVFNDLTENPYKYHIKKLAKKYKEKDKFYVISGDAKKIENINQKFNLDALGAVYLSKEINFKKNNNNSKRITIYKFNGFNFVRSNKADLKNDKNKKIWTNITSSSKETRFGNSKIKAFFKLFSNISIYGFKEHINMNNINAKKIDSDFVCFDEFCLNYIKTNKIDVDELRFAHKSVSLFNINFDIPKDGELSKLIQENEKLKELKMKYKDYYFLIPFINDNKDIKSKNLLKEYNSLKNKKYPLLNHLTYSAPKEAIEEYIELIDKKL